MSDAIIKIRECERLKLDYLKPDYLRRGIIDTDKTRLVRRVLKNYELNTVCENARCPNKSECYSKNTATFMIMGKNCTRNCTYCNISCESPEPLDVNEPENLARAVKDLRLEYVVITSVRVMICPTEERSILRIVLRLFAGLQKLRS
jgi:lipoic acid synthetase